MLKLLRSAIKKYFWKNIEKVKFMVILLLVSQISIITIVTKDKPRKKYELIFEKLRQKIKYWLGSSSYNNYIVYIV